MLPLGFFIVHPCLDLSRAVRARPAASHKTEAFILQHVESLLKKRMLQEESARVAIAFASIRITALVQRILEDFSAERDFPADGNPAQFAEFDIRQSVTTKSKGASVANGYISRSSVSKRRWYRTGIRHRWSLSIVVWESQFVRRCWL